MLKPSDLGLTGTERSLSQYEKAVLSKVKALRNKSVSIACESIATDGHPGSIIPIVGITAKDINEIKNYFAEVVAPILICRDGSVPGVTKQTKVFYSTSDTERLYDFKLINGTEQILVSNKQMSGGTNTLKPGDVISLVDKDPTLSKKWKRTKYYDIFKILDESNVVSGPIKAVAAHYPRMSPLTDAEYNKVISKLTKNDVLIEPSDVPKNMMTMINNDPSALENYKKNRGLTGTAINFMFEKILVNESKTDDKYNELFVDVTSGNVLFFKFDLDSKGKLSYGISDPKKSVKKAYLRSKQGVERRSQSTGRLKLDKLGFQP